MVKTIEQGVTEARRLLTKTVHQIVNSRDEDMVVSIRNRGELKAFLIPPWILVDYLHLLDEARTKATDLNPGGELFEETPNEKTTTLNANTSTQS